MRKLDLKVDADGDVHVGDDAGRNLGVICIHGPERFRLGYDWGRLRTFDRFGDAVRFVTRFENARRVVENLP